MSEGLLVQVTRALSGRYRIDRELGRGGMGAVFLGTDEQTGRALAVKVLRPEVSAALGNERFLREINIALELQHPNLLPVIESGEAGGLLYFTMPFVDGPTVRDRLDRGGPMAEGDAVDVVVQVAAALAYAHHHGVIHRDIKPENILLSGDGVLLADFGIARLLGSGGAEALTSTGFAIGTPAYMSPEQGVSDRVDERTDQYSLGCVFYEMLAGTPPFSGPDARAIIARHMTDPVPPLRTIRPGISVALEGVILRALAKHPADRWASITTFAEAVRASLSAELPAPTLQYFAPRPKPLRAPPAAWTRRLMIAGAIAMVILISWLVTRAPAPNPAADLIAVLPFAIEGRLDGALTPAGVADLMAARLAGVARYRIVKPDASARGAGLPPASAGAARGIARRLGAGMVLTGQMFADSGKVAIDAWLHRSADGLEIARVDRLTDSPRNLLAALDRVVITLLARAMGEPEYRIPGLAARPPEAANAYLDAGWLFRRGRYREATARLERALAADSTFALAGLSAYRAGSLAGLDAEANAGWAVAEGHSGQLAAPDSDFYATLAGPSGPIPASYKERIVAWTRLVGNYPLSHEATYTMAEELIAWGPATGNLAAHEQGANLLSKALADDSALAPNLELLLDLAALRGDTADLRRLASIFLALNPRADHRDWVEWELAMARDAPGHTALAESLVAHASASTLQHMVLIATVTGHALDDAHLAVGALRGRAATDRDAWLAAYWGAGLAHNMGRPSEAPEPPPSAPPWGRAAEPLFQVIRALYWDGDSASAAHVVQQRSTVAERTPPDPRADNARYMDICAVGLWRAAEKQWEAVHRAAAFLARAKEAEQADRAYIPLCGAILSTMAQAAIRSPAAEQAITRLDSLAASVPQTNPYILLAANLTVAAARERQGDIPNALVAVRRRAYAPGYGEVGLSTYLREEGRLAALAGQTTQAVDAYQKYLALRRNPEPRLRVQRAQVQEALVALTSERP